MRQYRTPAALPPLTPELREVIVGCALLNIERRSANGSTRLRFEQGGANSAYLYTLYSLFEPYCSSAPKVYTDSNGRTSVRFNTLSSLIFTEFNSLFYLERVKHVPPNIGDLLTARALAFWAMD
jgi:hypothetical protein